MNPRVEIDTTTAVKVAEYFEATGMPGAAINVWQTLCNAAPYDRRARERLADLTFDFRQSQFPVGSLERSRFVMQTMSKGYPTAKLAAAYFENLQRLLAARVKRARPGDVILGLGAGRCGSTTLAAAFGNVEDACATHENHPFIYWQPQPEQVRFHFDRFRLLADYHPLVFDASHWWINVLEQFFAEFPRGKTVGLIRETEPCVQSFLHVKGRGPDSINHWAPQGNTVWPPNLWDPVYPSFPVPPDLVADPEAAKAALIRRYVDEYNESLRGLAKKFGQRVLILRTEELSDPATSARLTTFVGIPLTIPDARLNAGTVSDADTEQFVF